MCVQLHLCCPCSYARARSKEAMVPLHSSQAYAMLSHLGKAAVTKGPGPGRQTSLHPTAHMTRLPNPVTLWQGKEWQRSPDRGLGENKVSPTQLCRSGLRPRQALGRGSVQPSGRQAMPARPWQWEAAYWGVRTGSRNHPESSWGRDMDNWARSV